MTSLPVNADQAVFPGMEKLVQVCEATVEAKDEVARFQEFTKSHGALLTQAQAALLLGVSRARVNQFVGEGRLPTVSFTLRVKTESEELRFIPGTALVEFMGREKLKVGRPSKARLALAALQVR